jgi:hypothetical protein
LLGATSKPATIVYDTIYTGNSAASAADIYFASLSASPQLKDDFLLTYPFSSSTALRLVSCTPAAIGALDNIIFANGSSLLQCPQAASTLNIATVSVLTSFFPPGVVVGDGVLGGALCADTGCIPYASCPSTASVPTSCLSGLFPGWSTGDDGLTSLASSKTAPDGGVGASGWALSPSIPCALARSGTPITTVSVDINSAARSATKPTVGAQETAACL